MTNIQPGEKIELSVTFSRNGEAATPTGNVVAKIKPKGGEWGNDIACSPQGGGVYTAETTAPAEIGYYVARFTSDDGGIEEVEFTVTEL